jgi:hypothetical protein
MGANRGKGRPYGTIWINGRHRPASQVAWSLHRGKPWPVGMDAAHTCDNPGCVNPLHIFPATPSANALDASAKGRLNRVQPKWTHCRNGHEFTADNTQMRGNWRVCKTCRKARNDARYRRDQG